MEGRTFEFSFPLPGSAQRKRNPSKIAGPGKNAEPKTQKDPKAGTSGSPKPKSSVHQLNGDNTPQETPLAKTNGTRQNRRAYEKVRNKTPERREYNRRLAQEQRQKAKELGQCPHCGEPAIPGQTRCEQCAEQHRVSRRAYDRRRGAVAKQARGDLPDRPAAPESTSNTTPQPARRTNDPCPKPPKGTNTSPQTRSSCRCEGTPSNKAQVGSAGLRQDPLGVPCVFSPDVHSQFRSISQTDSRH